MKKEFIKFLITALSVLLIVSSLDFSFGKLMHWILPQISNQGEIGKTYFALNEVDTPIVIIGSSRASHHYVTQMIEDSLGFRTYNVGCDGCFYNYNCCVINSILDRYNPKLIIWENSAEYLNEEILDPLENLYPYVGCNEYVSNTIKDELPWTEELRINCNFYKFNSLSHRMLMRYLNRNKFVCDSMKGYLPLVPKDLKSPLLLHNETAVCRSLSKSKVERFKSILSRTQDNGVKLIVVDSPKYIIRNSEEASLNEMRSLCRLYGAVFIDNSQVSFFLKHPEYFNDYTHLNEIGAKLYTEFFIGQILSLRDDITVP